MECVTSATLIFCTLSLLQAVIVNIKIKMKNTEKLTLSHFFFINGASLKSEKWAILNLRYRMSNKKMCECLDRNFTKGCV